MVIVFETAEERDIHPKGGPTMKEEYGKDWPKFEKEILKNPRDFKLWVMYNGPDTRAFHSLRSHSRKVDPLVLPANVWIPMEYKTPEEGGVYRWVGRTRYTPNGGISPEDQFLEDVKFLLKYRKRAFKISLTDPAKDAELSKMAYIDKRILIGGINPKTNDNSLKKQEIIDAINDRFDTDYKYGDQTKADFIKIWLDLNEKEVQKELN